MLAETYAWLILVVEYESACIIDSPLFGRKPGKLVDVVLDSRVASVTVELAFQHFVCCECVSFCCVGVFELQSTIEELSRLESTGFHSMEDVLDIHHLHRMQVECWLLVSISAHALYFLCEHRQVEFC